MAKAPTLTTIATGYYSTTALNDNFDNIETAFENTLSLDGSTPNAMNADLDMNGYSILNYGALSGDAASNAAIDAHLNTGTASSGEVLSWNGSDYDWVSRLQASDIGVTVQAYDAGLTSIAGLPTIADKMLYTTGTDTWDTATITSFARTILDDADAGTVRTTLGVGTSDSPTFAGGTFNGDVGVTGTVTLDDTLRLDGNSPQILIFESDIPNNHRILAFSGSLYIQARDSDNTDDGNLYLTGYNGNDAEIVEVRATTFNANGNITVGGTVDGRDIATDGTKLDGIEALADVTDTANVTAAGALMDSELTSEASVKALNQGVATTNSPTFTGITTSGGGAHRVNAGTGSGYADFQNAASTGGAKVEASSGTNTDTFIDFDAPAISGTGGKVTYRFGRGTTEATPGASQIVVHSHDGTGSTAAYIQSDGDAFFAGNATVGGTLDVSGTVTLDNTLTIAGVNPQFVFSETDIPNTHRIFGSGGNFYLQAQDTDGTNDGTMVFSGYNAAAAKLVQASTAQFTVTGNSTVNGNSTVLGNLTVDTSTLKVDSTNNRVGIGTTSPSTTLDVAGNALVTGDVDVTGTIGQTTTTVASLPTGAAGDRSFVTDANSTTFASVVAGGGSNGVPVYHDGTNWRIG